MRWKRQNVYPVSALGAGMLIALIPVMLTDFSSPLSSTVRLVVCAGFLVAVALQVWGMVLTKPVRPWQEKKAGRPGGHAPG